MNEAVRPVMVRQRVSMLKQGPQEPIVAYLDRCDDFEAGADDVIKKTTSIRTVQGLNDRHEAEQILYGLSKEQ